MLNKSEISTLANCLSETSLFISDLRKREPISRHVQYPKIPPAFSESLAAHAIIDGLVLDGGPRISSVRLGGQHADIIVTTENSGELKIETKASGPQEFATFGEKDYNCDILLWLLFGDQFRLGKFSTVKVIICKKPADHLPWRKTRVTKKQLLTAWQGCLQEVTIDLKKLLLGTTAKSCHVKE